MWNFHFRMKIHHFPYFSPMAAPLLHAYGLIKVQQPYLANMTSSRRNVLTKYKLAIACQHINCQFRQCTEWLCTEWQCSKPPVVLYPLPSSHAARNRESQTKDTNIFTCCEQFTLISLSLKFSARFKLPLRISTLI